MKKDKLIELFVECYDNCNLRSKIEIHNLYVRENNFSYEGEIERNDEDFFNLFFKGKPMEAVRASFYGIYHYYDDWVWFNAYGNLESGDDEEHLPLRDAEEMAEWYINNYDETKYFEEMSEFHEACEIGDDDDDEGDEDEGDEDEEN